MASLIRGRALWFHAVLWHTLCVRDPPNPSDLVCVSRLLGAAVSWCCRCANQCSHLGTCWGMDANSTAVDGTCECNHGQEVHGGFVGIAHAHVQCSAEQWWHTARTSSGKLLLILPAFQDQGDTSSTKQYGCSHAGGGLLGAVDVQGRQRGELLQQLL